MIITPLTRPIVRKIGKLVVKLAPGGLSIRGHRRRKWRFIPWEQVAAATSHEEAPLIFLSEFQDGEAKLLEITTPRRKRAK